MAYQCRQCSYVASETGNCPVCNIPMDIRSQEEGMPEVVLPTEETTEAPAEQPAEAPMPDAVPAEADPAAPVVEEDDEEEL